MPWSYPDNIPPSMKYLKPSIQKKAIGIANHVLSSTGNDGIAIATGIKKAKQHHDSLVKLAGLVPRTRDNTSSMNVQTRDFGGYFTKVDPKLLSLRNDPFPYRVKVNAMDPRSFWNRMNAPTYSVFDNSNDIKAIHRLGIKHELHEADYAKRLVAENNFQNTMANVSMAGTPTGRHFSLGVLGKESNDLLNISNNKVRNQIQMERYLSGETEILKKITGKRYGIDAFTEQDLEKLHMATIKSKGQSFNAKSKSTIGTIAGLSLGALTGRSLSKKTDDEDTRALKIAGGGIIGGMVGGPAERFIRTTLLKLHKR